MGYTIECISRRVRSFALRLLPASLSLFMLWGIKKRQLTTSGRNGDNSGREVENLFAHILLLSLTLHFFPYFSKT